MKKGMRVPQLLLAIVATLFFIGVSVVGTLAFRPLYYHDMRTLDISGQSGYSDEEIRENYDALIDYNLPFRDGVLEFPTLPQSEQGRVHFEQVKDIFDVFKYFALFGGILTVAGAVWFLRKKEYRFLKYTAICSFLLPAVLGFFVGICWEKVFILFHKLFFNNDYWMFDYRTDPVILILPDEFFMHCAILIFAGVMLGAAACLTAYFILKRFFAKDKGAEACGK